MASRVGFKWSINEMLALQREYELLEWSIQDIAVKHERTERAILCKLESEGLISSWCDAKGYLGEEEEMSCVEVNCEESIVSDGGSIIAGHCVSDVDKLTERIWNLETNVDEIRSIVTQMLDVIGKDKKLNSPKQSSRF
jgi:hypothetical protein